MIIALNNKSNLTKTEFITYQSELSKIKTTHQVIVCPSSLYLGLFNLKNIELGSQNVSSFTMGAHTGEIAAQQLISLNVKYCIVGHSERREKLKETDEQINQKIKLLLNNNIIPILCIGESATAKAEGKTLEIIQKQLQEATQDLSLEHREKIIFAYEPIWSIGTGNIPTPQEIVEVFTKIKESYPHNKVLYGGSANDTNIDTLKKVPEIDGYLLGGLSLQPKKLQSFLEKLEN